MSANFPALNDALERNANFVAANLDYSLTGWVKVTGSAPANLEENAVCGYINAGNTAWAGFYTVSNGTTETLRLKINNGSSSAIRTAGNLARDQWYPFAYVRTGTTNRTYFNRFLAGTNTLDMSAATWAKFLIGGDGAGTVDPPNIQVAHVREWEGRVLTLAELYLEWNSYSPLALTDLYTNYELLTNAVDSANGFDLSTVGSVAYIATPSVPPVVTAGSIVIPADDAIATFDPGNSAGATSLTRLGVLDQNLLMQPGWTSFAANEQGKTLSSGIFMFAGEFPTNDDNVEALYVYNPDFTLIARIISIVPAVSAADPSTFNPISSNNEDIFYWLVSGGGAQSTLYLIGDDGVVNGTSYLFPATGYATAAMRRPRLLAISPDETIAYWLVEGPSFNGHGEAIRTYNLSTLSAGADLLTFGATEEPSRDLLCLPGGDLILLYNTDTTQPSSAVEWEIRRYTSAGVLVWSTPLGVLQTSDAYPRITLDQTDDEILWVWGFDDASLATALLKIINIETGAVEDTFTVDLIFGTGDTALSCPVMIMGIGSPIPPEPIPNELSGLYYIEPGKRDDTLWQSLDPEITKNVKIPRPFAKGPLLGE